MKPYIKVLGAYGTKSKGFGTSSFYLNKHNVIDAGNLLNSLEEQSTEIQNIWLTHSHLDHISDIAYILDSYYQQRETTLNIMALPETIESIKKHFLNDTIWPDFSKIHLMNSTDMSIVYKEIEYGVEYKLSENETIKPYETDHLVPSCGYIYKNKNNAILISADTYSLQTTVEELNKDTDINTAIIECSFPSDMKKLAKDSKHLTPKLIQEQLKSLKRDNISMYIHHMKPSFLEIINKEITQNRDVVTLKILTDGEILNF
jgi:cAMP phosphodiesterase